MKKLLLPLPLLALFLTACSLPIASTSPEPLPSLISTREITTSAYPYPAPIATDTSTPAIHLTAYPVPDSYKTSTPFSPTSSYEPNPNDKSLKRDQVIIDMASSQMVVTTTRPLQVKAILTGTLPDQCHDLRVEVSLQDNNGKIIIQVYSLFDPNNACVTGVKQFTANIPLGSYVTGQHVIIVAANYVLPLGQFDASYGPQPGDALLARGEVTLDKILTRLAITGANFNLPAVNLQGDLPDSCHQLRISFTPPVHENKVNLEVYSVFDPQTTCDAAITPFQVIYPLGYKGSGQSEVYVNGQYLGKFAWGG